MSTDSLELIERAVELMREQARAATPGPWRDEATGSTGPVVMDVESMNARDHVAQCPNYYGAFDAKHIASWHPAVALAVADWLDAEAADCEESNRRPGGYAAAVASAYLGTEEL